MNLFYILLSMKTYDLSQGLRCLTVSLKLLTSLSYLSTSGINVCFFWFSVFSSNFFHIFILLMPGYHLRICGQFIDIALFDLPL